MSSGKKFLLYLLFIVGGVGLVAVILFSLKVLSDRYSEKQQEEIRAEAQ